MEIDEVYIVTGYKGYPKSVVAKGSKGRRRQLKGARGRGTAATDKPPVLSIIKCNGEVIVKMLDDVKQMSIKPVIESYVKKGSLIYSDEYCIYDRLEKWGYKHKSVNHSKKSMLETMMETVFVKCILTLSRDFGHCLDHDYVLIEAFHKRIYLCI